MLPVTMRIAPDGSFTTLTSDESEAYRDGGALGATVRRRVHDALIREADRVGWLGSLEVRDERGRTLASIGH